MHVFADFKNNVIDDLTLNNVLKLVTVYLILLMDYLHIYIVVYLEYQLIKINIIKHLIKYIFSQNNKNFVPDDNELRFSLDHDNYYQNLPLSRLLMLDIENGNTKEKLFTSNLTVERIMPQTLSKSWR